MEQRIQKQTHTSMTIWFFRFVSLSKLVQEKNQIFLCKKGKLDMTHITSKNCLKHGLYIQI